MGVLPFCADDRLMAWFDLKYPCSNCPFRRSQARNYGLSRERLTEIVNATAFECHKTTGVAGQKKDPQQCAGLIALLNAAVRPNAIMQVAQRLEGRRFDYVDTSDTFIEVEEMIKGHNPED